MSPARRATWSTVLRAARPLVAALVLAGGQVAAGVSGAAGPAAAQAPDPAQGVAGTEVRLSLHSQSPAVRPGAPLRLALGVDAAPPGSTLQVVVHDRVRSRSELHVSFEGRGLRRTLHRTVPAPLDELPPAPEGGVVLTVPTAPGGTGGGDAGVLALPAPGAYPTEILALDADGRLVDRLVTHLVASPGPEEEVTPLAVALVTGLDAPTALRPDGDRELHLEDAEGAGSVFEAFAEHRQVPATLVVAPEVLDALAASEDPGHVALLEALRRAATDRSIARRTFAHASPDTLRAAGLDEQLARQLSWGDTVLAEHLGGDVEDTVWFAGADLDAPGVDALAAAGVRHVVVDDDRVAPLAPEATTLSLAHRFGLRPSHAQPVAPRGTDEPDPGEPGDGDRDGAVPTGIAAVDAMAFDTLLGERLDDDASPALVAGRVFAELSVVWAEQPSVPRAVVLELGPRTPGGVVREVLDGIAASRAIEPVDVATAFDRARPLTVDGAPVRRALVPVASRSMGAAEAQAIRDAADLLGSYQSLVGPLSERYEPLLAHLLVAQAADVDRGERRRHLERVTDGVAGLADAVEAPARDHVTLTARTGTIPVTITNGAGHPVNVVVRLSSPKLEFPDGERLPLTLTSARTRVDIGVRTLASGTFPLEVEVTAPDGRLLLTRTRVSVQSTAVSGVGVVLSAGAGLFLLVWWARHWRRTRRSRRLVPRGEGPPH